MISALGLLHDFKSIFHFGDCPGKISPFRVGGLPRQELERSAKAEAGTDGLGDDQQVFCRRARYWAASTSPGKDAVISEEKIQMGSKLATKLWNVSRFAERFIAGYDLPDQLHPFAC
jgi:hypothetical protein